MAAHLSLEPVPQLWGADPLELCRATVSGLYLEQGDSDLLGNLGRGWQVTPGGPRGRRQFPSDWVVLLLSRPALGVGDLRCLTALRQRHRPQWLGRRSGPLDRHRRQGHPAGSLDSVALLGRSPVACRRPDQRAQRRGPVGSGRGPLVRRSAWSACQQTGSESFFCLLGDVGPWRCGHAALTWDRTGAEVSAGLLGGGGCLRWLGAGGEWLCSRA